jgi:hypothetical protein
MVREIEVRSNVGNEIASYRHDSPIVAVKRVYSVQHSTVRFITWGKVLTRKRRRFSFDPHSA